MATSQSIPTSTTSIASKATTVTPSQTTNPAFFGYVSSAVVGGSTVYASENCAVPETFYVSNGYATCCSAACTPFTGCLSQSVLLAASSTRTCTGSSTCKTDLIYPTEGLTDPTLGLYCGVGPNSNWYRTLPQDGIDSSNTAAISAATPPSTSNSLFGPLGGGIGGLAFLLFCGALLCCLCQRRNRGPASRPSYRPQPYWPAPRDGFNRDQQRTDYFNSEQQRRADQNDDMWRRNWEEQRRIDDQERAAQDYADNQQWQRDADAQAQAQRDADDARAQAQRDADDYQWQQQQQNY